MKSLTLHIQPGLVPVLPFSVNGFTLVSSHVFILYIVEMKHSSGFTDLMVWRQVRGIDLPPNNVGDRAEKTH